METLVLEQYLRVLYPEVRTKRGIPPLLQKLLHSLRLILLHGKALETIGMQASYILAGVSLRGLGLVQTLITLAKPRY